MESRVDSCSLAVLGRRWVLMWALQCACVLSALGSLWAQSEVGAIRGKVQDADFFVPVGSAEVIVEGTSSRSLTDDEGNFFINSVPSGEYALLVTKPGYIRERIRGVVVTPGSVKQTEVAITAEVVELDDFVVQTIVEEPIAVSQVELGAALQSFASAISPELLKAGGSGGDIGSATKRLAATAVVDSRYVVIRGLSDRYLAVVLNGARVPSSDPDKRAVNIDIFPSGLVETLVSAKTFVPSMPGEATGGYLNIITKRIPDKPFVNFSYSSSINTQVHGERTFLNDPSLGTGFLGTRRERALPDQLRAYNDLTLPRGTGGPFGNTVSWQVPPRTFGALAAADRRNAEFHQNRQTASTILLGRRTGVDVSEAPINFSASLLAGNRVEDFLGGTLGIIGGFTYSKRYESDIGVRGTAAVLAPGVVQPLQYNVYQKGEESLLAGGLLGATLEFSPDSTVSLTYFTNIAADDKAIFSYGENVALGNIGNGIPVEDESQILFREGLIYTERLLQTMQLTGEHVFPSYGDVKVDWLGAYSISSQDQPDIRKSLYAYDFDLNTYVPSGDPSPPEFERVWRRLDDTNYNVALNIDFPLEDRKGAGPSFAKIELGGSMDYSTRTYVTENFEYEVRALASPLLPRLSKPVSSTGTADNSRGTTLADALETAALADHLPGRPAAGGRTSFTDGIFLARGVNLPVRETYTATQPIPAAYLSTSVDLGETFDVTFGARVESTDIDIVTGTAFGDLSATSSSAQLLLFDPLTGEPLPAEDLANPGITRTDLLPAIAVNWDVAQDHTVRAAISRTLARPTFKELAPTITRDPESGDLFVGYVLLEMSSIVNFDTRYEWDLGAGDQIAFSLFAKRIAKPIEYVYNGLFNTVRNDESAALYGFEIELNKGLGEIWPTLEGITFSLNYGYVFSQVTLNEFNRQSRATALLPTTRPLQGQPDYTFNANVVYDNKDFGVSAGVLLNVTGPLLYSVGGRANFANIDVPDVYQLAYTSLDAYLSKKLFGNWELSFRVSNLLDQPRRRLFDGGLPFSDLKFGTVYTAGLSGKF